MVLIEMDKKLYVSPHGQQMYLKKYCIISIHWIMMQLKTTTFDKKPGFMVSFYRAVLPKLDNYSQDS